jgi:hypothetical protein
MNYIIEYEKFDSFLKKKKIYFFMTLDILLIFLFLFF